jgi:F-type H+-transporting ATPase subunit epsilon
MAKLLRINVVTVDGQSLEDEAVSVRAPGGRGAFGVLHNHAPMVSTLSDGVLQWRRADGTTRRVKISGGLCEVSNNTVTVLTNKMAELEPEAAVRHAI